MQLQKRNLSSVTSAGRHTILQLGLHPYGKVWGIQEQLSQLTDCNLLLWGLIVRHSLLRGRPCSRYRCGLLGTSCSSGSRDCVGLETAANEVTVGLCVPAAYELQAMGVAAVKQPKVCQLLCRKELAYSQRLVTQTSIPCSRLTVYCRARQPT